jgi:16S rRNA (adenine1518-N6/adenine1519-N6)-dimethyltransferase
LNLARKPAPFLFTAPVKALIRACFQQRRKQIAALLRGRLAGAAAPAWLAGLTAAGLGPQARPEQISVALWQKLRVV